MPVAAAPIIAAGISAVAQGATAYAQGKMNKKTRNWNEMMYGLQRRDALADWNMQNEYNTPENQMARFKAAGLNPHLIYGQGSSGEAGVVRSSSAPTWTPKSAEFDGNSVTGAYFQAKQQQNVNDMLEYQKRLAEAEIELKKAQTIGQNVQSAGGTFDLALKNTLRDRNIELAALSNEQKKREISKMEQDYDFSRRIMSMGIQQNDLDAAMKATNTAGAIQAIANAKINAAKTSAEISNIKQQTKNAVLDSKVKELDAQIAEKHVRPGDPLWLRNLYIILDKWFK